MPGAGQHAGDAIVIKVLGILAIQSSSQLHNVHLSASGQQSYKMKQAETQSALLEAGSDGWPVNSQLVGIVVDVYTLLQNIKHNVMCMTPNDS